MKLSIIIPVYNLENYLENCLDSVCSQSFTDLEVLLVDDGSTDDTAAICQAYCRVDKRLRYFQQANQGQGAARNKGLDYAQGEYIGFVDGDDYIHPQMYEVLIKEAEEKEAAIAICPYKCTQSIEQMTKYLGDTHTLTLTTEEAFFQLLKGQLYRHGVCNKIYKREVLGHIRFPEGVIYEDNFFTYRVIARAKKVVYYQEPLYFYLQREGSTINRQLEEKHLALFDAGAEMIEFTKDTFPELRVMAEYAYALRFFDFAQQIKGQINR